MLPSCSFPIRYVRVSRQGTRRVTLRPISSHSTSSQRTRFVGSRNVYTAIVFIGGIAVTATGLWWSTASTTPVPILDLIPPETAGEGPQGWREETTRILARSAYSYSVYDIPGVSRYDGVRLAASSPCEDRYFHGAFDVPSSSKNKWMAWAVMDGHNGWQTAELLTQQLLSWVRRAFDSVPKPEPPMTTELVHDAIKQSFLDLDESIVQSATRLEEENLSLPAKMKLLTRGFAGSCALLSLYDPELRRLHVACTGDSRAVLGRRRSDDGSWEVIALTVDQTGSNKDEIDRLDREHPGEIDDILVKKGRVLGLSVSRAFGDGKWKWPKKLQHDLIRKYYGPLSMQHKYKTPPYLTAEPVITSFTIDPSRDYFLILATDGLWDFLTNEDAVDLIGAWLIESSGTKRHPFVNTSDFAKSPFTFDRITKDTFKFARERTTVEDDNVAVHLLRNLLGGNVHELVAGRVAVKPPFARKLGDDITIQVVFLSDTLHSSKKGE